MLQFPDSTQQTTIYDALGRTIVKADQAGKQTQYFYDALGHLIRVIDALGAITSYTYDEVGNQISQTDANNHTTTFAYDSLGRRVKRTLPLGMSESYQYDAVGNQTKKTDFNARTTSYAYDNMNRMTQKTPDPSFSSVPITFTYTSTDQRASMTDQSGTSSYTYDNRDRLLTKATPEGIITYTYDAQGNLLSMNSSNSNGTSVNYSYDVLNRLLTIQDNRLSTGNKMSTYTYDAVGNIATFIYSNGLETTYAYDTLNRLVNLHSTYGPTIASYAYTLGATGNRLSVTELSGRVVKYIYDAAYKLTNETITTDPNSINGAISYAYDPVGNRLTRNSTASPVPNQTLTYDANDRLTSDGYDANGSTTSSGANTYSYDFENHLINSNAGGGISVTYDGDGNRVSRMVGGTITKYLIDDLNPTGYAQVLEEISGGSVQRTYTYGLARITETQSSGTSFYGYDGHGSVRFLMDESGTITDRYDYDAFGNLLNQTGTTPNVYLYSGEQLDSSLNLYNLRARYMNQATGRFWTMDSFEGNNEDPISLHKYTYTGNEPIDESDPTGHDTLAELVTASVIVGILATMPNVAEASLLGHFNNDVTLYMRAFAPWATFGGGFGGDARSFTTAMNVTSRINSMVEFDATTHNIYDSKVWSDQSSLGPFKATANPSITVQNTNNTLSVDVSGSNPLVPFVAPPIKLHLKLNTTVQSGGVCYDGSLTGTAFPDAEVFVSRTNKTTVLDDFATTGDRNTGVLLLYGDNRPMGTFNVCD